MPAACRDGTEPRRRADRRGAAELADERLRQARGDEPAGLCGHVIRGRRPEKGVPAASISDVEAALSKTNLSPAEQKAITDDYAAAELDALKEALLAAAAFSLLGLWLVRRLRGEPLGRADAVAESPAEPPERTTAPAAA